MRIRYFSRCEYVKRNYVNDLQQNMVTDLNILGQVSIILDPDVQFHLFVVLKLKDTIVYTS